MVANVNSPNFRAARTSPSNARITPTSKRSRFIATRSVCLLIEEEADGCIFQFGPVRLWIDRVPNLSHPDIWLELETNDTEGCRGLSQESAALRGAMKSNSCARTLMVSGFPIRPG